MSGNTWPAGERRAMTQSEHVSWNANNYPGTLQLCSNCDAPTGRCEEDELLTTDGYPLCEECFRRSVPIDEEGQSDAE